MARLRAGERHAKMNLFIFYKQAVFASLRVWTPLRLAVIELYDKTYIKLHRLPRTLSMLKSALLSYNNSSIADFFNEVTYVYVYTWPYLHNYVQPYLHTYPDIQADT